jgi:hypothetical protein
MMEAVNVSQKSVNLYEIAWICIQEDSHFKEQFVQVTLFLTSVYFDKNIHE